jgi:hypothetical protein
VTSFRRNIIKETAPYHNAVQVYKSRAITLRDKASNSGISKQGQRVLLQAAEANEKAAEKMSYVRNWETSKSSVGAALGTAGDMYSSSIKGLRNVTNFLTDLVR